ncbi:FtsW/RodA/SpoVE family cell cycle protein [Arthrospira platensis]|jgi:cell division protein FtsW|uniref:Probable peptidoglycan glycosyltransferase FtsW n=1 Tax=Limnospira platensis NIES-46 TaxID=1236695 RepID=A0A5M3TBF5_LIMPL|nr:FtsW/RodA/SpoVE family cell cycle protein [Arthrospira platensis]AMW27155.1 cell division protein FtsW [Arthrospira platensis YZ]KDR55436.1 cell division protein FtsW [Arthrospira platensis str. Paraca]MBD2668554.1 FtsW/RodA/SpoVE family cell cycle protein [Arthrospira platensis FACHB-439]MBD2709235.1 FtsW/RodA/SpoVE family cell cycle protein [Arthrospira platensis FACHB-835]MDF2211357.1 FtsW/RodA/SpoVE family cell cycle protein [Arthrospira platensis NCB002]MDT9294951.1 FtsW/RodA/SpoVE fa
MRLRHLIPFFDPSAQNWATEARLLRWLTFVWLFIGLVAMFSASYPSALAEHGDGLYYFKRQVTWMLVGMVGFNVIVNTPVRVALRTAQWGLFTVMALLFLTIVPGLGTTINGATRWLALGPILVQPSELMKPFLILQAARFFPRWDRLSWRSRLTWLGIFLLVLLLILAQPNLSTTALCGMTLWLIALAAGQPLLYLGGTAVGGLMLATISISLREYQRKRVLSFMNPWADPVNDGYQLIQSLLAVGSGGLWGAGLGLSQQKLFYLPIQYSDFIFAVYAEEFGFVGGVLLLLLLVAYGTLALRVAQLADNIEHQLVAIGAMVVMVGQSLLNIGVATGVLPTTGLPLPLFSYGGSSMIASLAISALLIRVARESSEAQVIPIRPLAQNRG